MKITVFASALLLAWAAISAAEAGNSRQSTIEGRDLPAVSVPADISFGIAVKATADMMLCDVDRFSFTLLRDLAAEKAAAVAGRPKLEIEIEAQRAADKIRDDARSRQNGVREYCSRDEIGDYWLAWTVPLETRIAVDRLRQLRSEYVEAGLALEICDLGAEQIDTVEKFMRTSKNWGHRISGTDFVTSWHDVMKAFRRSEIEKEDFCGSYTENIIGLSDHPFLRDEGENR